MKFMAEQVLTEVEEEPGSEEVRTTKISICIFPSDALLRSPAGRSSRRYSWTRATVRLLNASFPARSLLTQHSLISVRCDFIFH